MAKMSNPKGKRARLPLSAYLAYLLVLSFLFTGVSFAAYVSSASGSDTASVAALDINMPYDFGSGFFNVDFDDHGKVNGTYESEVQIHCAQTYKDADGNPSAYQYSSGTDPAPNDTSNIYKTTVTVNGISCTLSGFAQAAVDRRNNVAIYEPNPDNLESVLKDGFSAEVAFVMPDLANASENTATIFSSGYGTGFYLQFYRASTSNPWYLNFAVHDGAGFETVSVPASRLTVGNYYHALCVYDSASGNLRLYLNGELEGTTSNVGTTMLFQSTEKFVIGIGGSVGAPASGYEEMVANVSANPFPYGGYITSFSLFDSPLTTAQAKGLYNTNLIDIGAKDYDVSYYHDLNLFAWDFTQSTSTELQGGKVFFIRNFNDAGEVSDVTMAYNVVVTLSEPLPAGISMTVTNNSVAYPETSITKISDNEWAYTYAFNNRFQAGVKKEYWHVITITAQNYASTSNKYITTDVSVEAVQVD